MCAGCGLPYSSSQFGLLQDGASGEVRKTCPCCPPTSRPGMAAGQTTNRRRNLEDGEERRGEEKQRQSDFCEYRGPTGTLKAGGSAQAEQAMQLLRKYVHPGPLSTPPRLPCETRTQCQQLVVGPQAHPFFLPRPRSIFRAAPLWKASGLEDANFEAKGGRIAQHFPLWRCHAATRFSVRSLVQGWPRRWMPTAIIIAHDRGRPWRTAA
jgi:hypothetical protein